MKLYSLEIEGFRRHLSTKVYFSDATFLIGENNLGKSSVLSALEILLNDVRKISEEGFYAIRSEEGTNQRVVDKVVLTAEFRNLPDEAKGWFGFKGRVLPYTVDEGSDETGLKIVFRKTFEPNKEYLVELMECKKSMKLAYARCKTLQDYIEAGLSEAVVNDIFPDADRSKKVSGKAALDAINQIDDLYDFDDTQQDWVKNPGGIPGNVLSRLPKFLFIPAQDKTEELQNNSGALVKTLNELFNDVRDDSENYKKAQEYLNKLALELDPNDENSEIGKLMGDLNGVLGEVFPDAGITAKPQLSDPNTVIKPTFNISMFSNIATPVSLQGTGMVRAAVFALLRFRNIRENMKNRREGSITRPLLIGFEEPEIYLHPNAANQMRDTIYDLAASPSNQIICTTHSPYMIDLSKKPSQTLNNLCLGKCELEYHGQPLNVEGISAFPFNTSHAFNQLHADDKTYVKMLLKVDDYVARVFFAKNVLIVEGDTEDIVLRETIDRMPEKVQRMIQQNWQIIKARGKATMVSLVKYLKVMGIGPIVIHDQDSGVPRAEMHNEPILLAIGDGSRRYMLENCVEDVLGYPAPTKEKPYTAYKYINDNWGTDWMGIPEGWRQLIQKVFGITSDSIEVTESEVCSEDQVAAGDQTAE